MQRKLLITALIVFILALASITALAGFFPSFGGSNNNTITYTVSWKGAFDSLAISMTGQLTPVCRNNDGNEVPGQTRVTLTNYAQTSTPLSGSNIKSYTFYVAGYPLPNGTGGELAMPAWNVAGCPNSNWNVSRLYG